MSIRIEDELVTCPGCSRNMTPADLCECEDDAFGPLCVSRCHVKWHEEWTA